MSQQDRANRSDTITVGIAIQKCATRLDDAGVFFGHGTDNATDEAAHLVLHALSLDPNREPEYLEHVVSKSQWAEIERQIGRRIETRMPAAYLTGSTWFAGLEFKTDKRTLVPRSPISELILDHFQPWIAADKVTRILDLCTGCGCIAIASAIAFPAASVDGADLSPDALSLAHENVELHQVQERVRLIESDLFTALAGNKYDIIVSNPPYVPLDEFRNLPEEYHWEPEMGLVAGSDGLDLVRLILRDAKQYLNDSGILVVEVGATQDLLEQAYPNVPFTWLDFVHGGSGVFVMSAQELDSYAANFYGR